jgi:hypothetical protein
MKTKCYSVRLQGLVSISDRAYKATAFDGSSAILPKSQVFGQDFAVCKSDAYWIASWILEQKDLQYSEKKVGWFNKDSGRMEPNITTIIEKHVPAKVEAVKVQPNQKLLRK